MLIRPYTGLEPFRRTVSPDFRLKHYGRRLISARFRRFSGRLLASV